MSTGLLATGIQIQEILRSENSRILCFEDTKASGIDQRADTVDPIISSNKGIMDFVHNIDFSRRSLISEI